MNNNTSLSTMTNDNHLINTILTDIPKKILEATLSAEKESQEKYEAINELIKKAPDMSTQEKIDAMDKRYKQRNQEMWQNLLIPAVFIGVIGVIVINNPDTLKTAHK